MGERGGRGWNVKVELYLSNYATKADLKSKQKATDVHTSNFAKKSDLACLKSEINKSDISC